MKRQLIPLIALLSLSIVAGAFAQNATAPQVAKAYCDAILKGDAAAIADALAAGSSSAAGAAIKPEQLAGAAFTLQAARTEKDLVTFPYTLKGPALEFPDHKVRGQLVLTRQQTTWKIVSDTILSPGGEKLMSIVAPHTPTLHPATTPAEKQAEKVVNSVMEAWKKGDAQAILALLTRKAQHENARPANAQDSSHHFNPKAASADATYSIQSVTTEGSTILVTVRITDPMDPLTANGALLRWRMKSEGEGWRIAKMIYVGPDDVALSIFDLENPSADAGMMELAMKEMSQSLGAAPAALGTTRAIPDSRGEASARPLPQAITLAEFEKSWKASDDINQVPAVAAIQSLCKEMNVKANLDPAVKGSQPVSVKTAGLSRLQAIEEICRQIAAHTEFGDGTVHILPGQTEMPTAASGPFAVWIDRLQQFPPYGTARLQVHVQSAGLPPAVAQSMTNGMAAPGAFSILSAESEPGVSLIDPNGPSAVTFNSQADEYSFAQSVQLRNLLRTVKKFTLKTQVTAQVPTKVVELKLPSLADAATAKQDAVQLTVKKKEKSPMAMPGETRYVVTFQVGGAQRNAVAIRFLDAARKVLHHSNGGAIGFVKEDEVSFTVQGEPASAVAVVTIEQKPVKFDLVLADIPLPLADQMPAHLDALTFAGHDAPVQIEFVGLVSKDNFFKNVKARLKNFSNKPIRTVIANGDCIDGSGKPSFKGIPVPFGREEMAAIVQAGGTGEITTSNWNAPMNTANIKLTLKQVQFADGSVWPEEPAHGATAEKSPPATAPHNAVYAPTELAELKSQNGHSVTVEGVVEKLTVKSRQVLLVQFKGYTRGALSGVCIADNEAAAHEALAGDFGASLVGKRVRLKGAVLLYKGHPEIEISDVKQIEVLDSPPK